MKARLELTVGRWRWAAAVLLLAPGLALASIGKISVLEGTAKRTNGGETQELKVGSEIELNDTIEVGPDSNLKLLLTDESVIMLSPGSRLIIDEATFEGQDRKGFAARLGFGKIWAKVKKALAGSDSKFEVQTDRAVAGVRGTIFRVDYDKTATTMVPTQKLRMVVRVVEGRVEVSQMVRKAVKGQVPGGKPPKKGERKQVAGPQQLSSPEEWEKKFVELQAQKQVTVEEELGRAVPLDMNAMRDSFGRFVDRNQ